MELVILLVTIFAIILLVWIKSVNVYGKDITYIDRNGAINIVNNEVERLQRGAEPKRKKILEKAIKSISKRIIKESKKRYTSLTVDINQYTYSDIHHVIGGFNLDIYLPSDLGDDLKKVFEELGYKVRHYPMRLQNHNDHSRLSITWE